jgi:hypothetical protein
MTYDPRGGGALNYFPCHYGTSKLTLRGPYRDRNARPVVVLGGTETYGKFIETPYPELLEQVCGQQVLNLGCVNAGVDVYLNDPTVLDICRDASVTVIELTGAQNISNRFYRVHPRRNDRFLRASTLLKSVFRNVDFTEFHFTRHLLAGLRDAAPEKFLLVAAELKDAWVARMQRLIAAIDGPVVLLWMADRQPDQVCDDPLARGGPLFVDARMIDILRDSVAGVVEVVADAEELHRGYDQLVFTDLDAPAASEMLGPVVHKRAAQRLAEVLRDL